MEHENPDPLPSPVGEAGGRSADSDGGEGSSPPRERGPFHRADLLKGTLDFLILKALTFGPEHGYGIARWLEDSSEDLLRIEEGSLYPALYRMEKRRWIRSEWGQSETNRKAKYYRLTPEGQRQLEVQSLGWERMVRAVSMVLRRDPA
jgi:transcriptional regulator